MTILNAFLHGNWVNKRSKKRKPLSYSQLVGCAISIVVSVSIWCFVVADFFYVVSYRSQLWHYSNSGTNKVYACDIKITPLKPKHNDYLSWMNVAFLVLPITVTLSLIWFIVDSFEDNYSFYFSNTTRAYLFNYL